MSEVNLVSENLDRFDSPVATPTTITGVWREHPDPNQIEAILRTMHYRRMGVTGGGDKWVNWMLDDGITVESVNRIAEGVEGLGLMGLMKYSDAGMETPLDLTLSDGRAAFRNHLATRWKKIPELRERLRVAYEESMPTSGAPALPDWQRHDDKWSRIDPALVPEGVRRDKQRGFVQQQVDPAMGDEGWLEFSLNSEFGGVNTGLFGAEDTEIQRIFDEVTNQFIDELAEQARYVAVISADQGASVDDLAPTSMFILSYDGTEWGDINTLADLYSGGQFGPIDAFEFLSDLEERTSEPGEPSMTIAKIQQELYAQGYLKDVPLEWGRLNPTGPDPTGAAFGDQQLDMVAEALRLADGDNERASTWDPYQVLDNVLLKRSKAAESRGVRREELEQSAYQDVAERVARIISDLGREVTPEGEERLMQEIETAMGNLDEDTDERLFGRGGLPEDVALAEAALAEYYGVDDWGEAVTFGHKDSDRSMFNYARLVGAISDEEYEIMVDGGAPPSAYRGVHTGATKDIAVANFLKHLGAELEPSQTALSSASSDQIQRALMTYSYSLGLRRQNEEGFLPDDFRGMAARAQKQMPVRGLPDPALGALSKEVIDQLGLSETVAGTGFDSLLRSVEATSGPAVTRSRIQNV